MTALCIIPARGGSQRIPRKNIRIFHGKPIIAYSIELALNCGFFDEVVVSTDDVDISSAASEFGAEYVLRPKYLCENSVGTQEVMKQEIDHCQEVFAKKYEYACCIYPCAPMIDRREFEYGFRLLQEAQYLKFSMPVGVDENGTHDPGQWYWGTAEAFLDGYPLQWREDPGFIICKLIIPRETDCDINTEEDWRRAEQMYAKLHGIESWESTAL